MSKNKQSIKFEAEVSGFKKEIEEMRKSITSLNKELKLNQEQLKGNENDSNLLTTRVETLSREYEEQNKVVENTNKVYERSVELFGKNSAEAKSWKDKLVDAETKQQKIKNALDEANKKLAEQSSKLIQNGKKWQEQGEKITKVGDKIEKVGNKLSVISAGIGAIVGGSLKASIDFETAFTGVEKTVDGTAEQIAELKQGILDMSTQLPSSTTEISAVAEAAGQLGIQTENILSFTRTMIDMGNSTNLSSDEAATSLARFANITQMSQKDFDKLGSSIVDLGNNFATTESEIVEMALRLAGAGKQVGMSEGQILGLATALSSVGIEAEMGGSALSKAMVKMQNAVEMGGKKLNNVLNKTGMSLRELELMSANDSMGFKELSSSIGMTSTELKQLITAGTNLEDFASISGMTAEQFKKAWKDDATGALTAFIKGLGTAEEKGESAIVLLSEMGLSEVRLRDSLLRAANAGDLFNSAIETGTKAWKQNTALTNEANKRYGTTESQLKILKNEVVKLGIEFGNELAPSLRQIIKDAKPLLTTVSSAVKKFSELDSTTKQNIIRVGAFVTAIGPVTKVLGQVTSGVGTVTSSIGKATEALGRINTGTQTTNSEVKLVTSAISQMSSATGILTLAVTALIGAYAVAKIQTAERQKYMTDEIYKLDEQIKSREELTKTVLKERDATIFQMDQVSKLKDELDSLVDTNGKVKDGYKDRVNFILNELNNALGTEFKITGDVINNYENLNKSVKDLIRTKKINAILESEEKLYNEGINEKAKAYESVANAQKNVNELQKKIAAWEEKNGKIDDSVQGKLLRGLTVTTDAHAELNGLRADLKVAQEELTKAEENYKQKMDNINTYTQDATVLLGKDVEAQEKLLQEKSIAHQNASDDIAESTKTSIENYLYDLNMFKKYKDEAIEKQDETSKKYYENQIEINEKALKEQIKHLSEMTSTTEEMTPAQIEAWKTLATNSNDIYKEEISKIPVEMRQKIQQATGEINSEIPAAEIATRSLAIRVTDELEKSAEARKSALETLQGFMNGLTDDEQRELLKNAGIKDVDEVMKGLKEGNLSEEQGKNVLKGILYGLDDKNWNEQLRAKASGLAKQLSELLTITPKIGAVQGASQALATIQAVQQKASGHADGLAYVPYNNYVARLHEGERVLSKKENAEYIRNNISNKNSRNVTVNIYPQTMTEGDMYKVSRFVNREWGEKS